MSNDALLPDMTESAPPVAITDNQDLTSVEQPESAEPQSQEANEVDWEKSAKHFQSEKDKLYEENKLLKNNNERFEALGKFVESRPDVQNYLNEVIEGEKQPQTPETPENFDPWEAYNDPNSESYKYRKSMEESAINNAVAKAKGDIEGKLKQDKELQDFDNQLKEQGLDDVERQRFYQFANTPVNEFSTDILVRMWQAADEKAQAGTETTVSPEIAQVQQTQSQPVSAGVLQGAKPEAPSDTDAMWEGIMNAANRTKVI
tara:strand:- start:20381 stop:21160 length:780 start_codon:yes stop_codon:yes gene_type:complete